ncbi:2-hydroxymuconic semialdehyde dehydrogenase [Sphingomonas populi]|uniref:2-hydroxymuconic semialdehyde dehydrogenase n=1 Tax=Sphingomonas populi TaxID=2484750 RepID=A0A4Q6Y2E7_9SPHN|nr:2-hydroxymuconic semialdehyde dehydrogenase [Sphingomonas populi]RZF63499.1 2-hydroxymuconic semialdehyde dehydrogenase [Sphingomonas populi]
MDKTSSSARPTDDNSGSDTPLRRCWVGGQWRESGATFVKTSPVDGHCVAHVVEADKALIDDAVAAARRAAAGEWGRFSASQRKALLHRIADGIENRFEEFVAAEVGDTGRPVEQARILDIRRGVANFRLFADLVADASGEVYETETPDGEGALSYTISRPHGVVAIISPWNLPFLLLTWKIAPALALGNAVVVKPSEETPSSATLLCEVIAEAGMPAGGFNLIHGHGAGAAGEFLTRHPGIDAITFTGETGTGQAIMRAAAEGVRPVSFELGGKNAALVFADADLEKALDGVARSTFLNCGQVCLCTERVYVERPIFEQFVAGMKARAERMVYGGSDAVTGLGPLISHEHREKVLGYYRLALEEGATVVVGGGTPQFGDDRDGGSWVEPTVITGLPQTARCLQEEVFGPITHIAPFDTEEEAIGLANDTVYGLAAAVWTRDVSRAHRVSRRMRVGITWVNTWFQRDLRTPFGGVRLSGLGREGGRHSLDFYCQPMTICVKI